MRLALLTLVFSLVAGLAAAQDRVFVQIEARPTLSQATERARAYRGLGEDINGFSLGNGWYGVALGPYEPARARRILRRLRGQGLIPRDSYVSDGASYRDRFWPAGGRGVAVTPDPVETRPRSGGGDAEIAGGSATPATPEETQRQARRSESLLSQADLMEIQRALRWFGHYGGAIDGRIGRGTRNSMAEWQNASALEVTGVLTTRQRRRLLEEYAAARAELGLAPVTVAEAGIALTAPMGLVRRDRIEAPFVHFEPEGESGVRLSLISETGDRATLGGLYQIVQTLDIVPEAGDRSRSGDEFRITGLARTRTTKVYAKLIGDHIVGYIFTWPAAQDDLAARALPEMERTLRSVGPALPAETGFDAAEQSFDMVSGLEVRRPLRSGAGFYIDERGTVLTAAGNVDGCGRVTLDGRYDATVTAARDGVALLAPETRLAPAEVASLAPTEGRLRSDVAVAGFPYGGVLNAATLTFGTLADVRGLDGEKGILRLSLTARPGDAGGPVFDPAGRVAGILLSAPENGGRNLPDDVAFARKSAALAKVLSDAGVTAARADAPAPLAPEDLTRRATALTVLVDCWE